MVVTGQALASRGQKGGFFLSVLGIILVVFGAAALILVAAAVFFFYVCSARGGETLAEDVYKRQICGKPADQLVIWGVAY